MALRIVIDANIIVSASFGGYPQKTVTLAFSLGEVFTTPKINEELLSLPDTLILKLGVEKQGILLFLLGTFLSNMKEIAPLKNIMVCRDPKDNAYLEACLAAKADILLTGDKDLLEISKKDLSGAGLPDLNIIKPAEFFKKYSHLG